MKGSDYTASVRLTNKAGEVLAEAGEVCERVPASSLGWLAEQGLIARTAKPAKAGKE